jgi:hypothetical protein
MKVKDLMEKEAARAPGPWVGSGKRMPGVYDESAWGGPMSVPGWVPEYLESMDIRNNRKYNLDKPENLLPNTYDQTRTPSFAESLVGVPKKTWIDKLKERASGYYDTASGAVKDWWQDEDTPAWQRGTAVGVPVAVGGGMLVNSLIQRARRKKREEEEEELRRRRG